MQHAAEINASDFICSTSSFRIPFPSSAANLCTSLSLSLSLSALHHFLLQDVGEGARGVLGGQYDGGGTAIVIPIATQHVKFNIIDVYMSISMNQAF
jgi:hypothetical protein